MKRKLTFFLVSLLSCVAAMAADLNEQVSYTGSLLVYVNGKAESTTTSTVYMTRTSDAPLKYTLAIKNFSFGSMKIGDVTLVNVKGETSPDDGNVKLTDVEQITVMKVIKVTVTLNGTLSADGSELSLNLDMGEVAKQTIVATFDSPGTKTAIDEIRVPVCGEEQIFNLAGQRVYDMTSRGIYIVRHADGTTSKVVKR